MKRATVAFACLMLVMGTIAVAQDLPITAREPGGKVESEVPAGADDCAGGIVHDDDTFENGYSGNAAAGVTDFGVGDLFVEAAPGEAYGRICVCLTALGGLASANVDFMVWDDDGAAGAPGTIMAMESLTATAIPAFPAGAWYSVDFAAPATADGTDFLGVRFAPDAQGAGPFVCADESVGTPLQTGFVEFLPNAPWGPTGVSFPGYRSMLIRTELAEGVPTVPVWGLILLGAVLLVVSLVAIRRFA